MATNMQRMSRLPRDTFRTAVIVLAELRARPQSAYKVAIATGAHLTSVNKVCHEAMAHGLLEEHARTRKNSVVYRWAR